MRLRAKARASCAPSHPAATAPMAAAMPAHGGYLGVSGLTVRLMSNGAVCLLRVGHTVAAGTVSELTPPFILYPAVDSRHGSNLRPDLQP
jgi:hypothetical protein